MNLEAWLKEEHTLDEQLRLIEGIAGALNEDHDKAILHRALEPFNVQVELDGACDLSGAVNADASTASAAARYRAPEILEGASYSPQADIFAVGMILYEMLSGQNPGASERPKPLGELRPDIPRDLTDAIMGCLEKGPDWRPKDLSYLLQVVRTMRSGGAGGGASPRAGRAPAAEALAHPVPAAPRSRRTAGGGTSGSPSQVPLIVAVLVLLAGAGVGGWLWLQGSGESGPTARRPTVVPSAPPSLEPRPTPTLNAPSATKATTPTPPPANANREPVASPAPTPKAVASTTAAPVAVSTPDPTPTPTPAPTLSVAAPPTATPAPATPETSAAPAEPVTLTAVSPLVLQRGQTRILDVRGTGLREDHRLRIVRAKVGTPATGFSVMRQRLFNPTRLEFLVKLDDGVEVGAYAALVVDSAGGQSNALAISVAK